MESHLKRMFLPLAALSIVAVSCGISYRQQRQLRQVREHGAAASLALARERELRRDSIGTYRYVQEMDTEQVIHLDGRDLKVMNAVRDDETGEMVATEQIQAAYVTARFRNVAERHGKIDIEFQVIVPQEMYNPEWQLRFYPDMYILEDSIRLENVIITGDGYRRRQLRGYEQYDRFLRSIVTDSALLVNTGLLERFLARNIPEVYKYKTDTSIVSDEVFYSHYNVSEQEAVDYYTYKLKKRFNQRRIASKERMRRRYIKAPIVTDGVRLDTIVRNMNGDFVYNYLETIRTRPGLRKVDVVLSGDIYQQDERLYTMERSDPLTFYISSLSSFAAPIERFLDRIVSRRVEANTRANIVFKVGRYDVDPSLGENREEIDRVKHVLSVLARNEEYDLDSIVVRSSCSPEGSWSSNDRLSLRRGTAISKYFNDYQRRILDSVKQEAGLSLAIGDEEVTQRDYRVIPFIGRRLAEDWEGLTEAVLSDGWLTPEEKVDYLQTVKGVHPDDDERALQRKPYYRHLRDSLYPGLRKTDFSFHLHRKDMAQDTIHTTVPDTVYARGVRALRERDYDQAVLLLRPYRDINTAIAYTAKDLNSSAMDILMELPETAETLYMKALIYSRLGYEPQAVELYRKSCEWNPSYVHRGNLDPEIYYLIKKYDLNALWN